MPATLDPVLRINGRSLPELPHQGRFFQLALSGNASHAGLIGGYGSGKTVAGTRLAILLAHMNPGLDGLYTCLTFPILIDAIIPQFEQQLRDYGFEEGIHYRLDGRQVCTFFSARNEDGVPSRILFRPVDGARNITKIVAATYAWAVKDESGLYAAETHRKIDERVRDGRAKHMVSADVTTPEGLGELYDRYVTMPRKRAASAGVVDGLCPDESFRMVRGRTMDNPHLSAAYVDTLLAQYPEHLVASYLEGHFVPNFTGRCFRFDEVDHVSRDAVYDPALPICMAWDFNVNPMSVSLNHFHQGRLWTFDEIVLEGSHTEDVCNAFMEQYGELGHDHQSGVRIFGDASGKARSTKARVTDYDLIREHIGQWMPGFDDRMVPRQNPGHRESINTLNALLKNGHGHVSYSIHPTCVETIKSLLTTVYDDSGSIDKGPDTYEHLSDGLRYMAWQVAPIDQTRRLGRPQVKRRGAARVR